jgi:DNA polymerase III epsilon subunit-like protein
MIFLDFETTGLTAPSVANPSAQPRIIEIGAVKVDEHFNEVAAFSELIDPEVLLTSEITRITGIHQRDLDGKRKFRVAVHEFAEFFIGERTVVGHNLEFDLSVLHHELKRVGWERRFPYPPEQICTIDGSLHIKGYRLKLTELYSLLHNETLQQTHRALDDVRALVQCFRKMTT